mmetsp:Transcript_52099/g.131671  ORF Transcript_52099/g.131671 Transcript_52099/m.131671 type:complete len:161 (-) Transcript_52099:298-780(-)
MCVSSRMVSLRVHTHLSLVFGIVAAAECLGDVPAAADDTVAVGKRVAAGSILCVLALLLIVPLRILCDAQPTQFVKKHIFSSDEIGQSFPEVQISDMPTCVICLTSIREEERGRRLQCSHEFHADCILTWWTHCSQSSLACPTCRQTQALMGPASDEGQP